MLQLEVMSKTYLLCFQLYQENKPKISMTIKICLKLMKMSIHSLKFPSQAKISKSIQTQAIYQLCKSPGILEPEITSHLAKRRALIRLHHLDTVMLKHKTAIIPSCQTN